MGGCCIVGSVIFIAGSMIVLLCLCLYLWLLVYDCIFFFGSVICVVGSNILVCSIYCKVNSLFFVLFYK